MRDATDVLFVMDRSGSMAPVWEDTVGGFNKFIEDQRALPGECRLTLVVFDTEFETICERQDVLEVGPLPASVVPRGCTALNDAVNHGIEKLGRALSALAESERPDKVLCVISTDGMENSSREITTDALKAKIKEQSEKWSWTFLYLGVGLEAFESAGSLGIARANTMSYMSQARFAAYSAGAVSAAVGNLRTTGSTGDWKKGSV